MPGLPPRYFALMCTRFLGCSPSLALELWRGYGQLFPEKLVSLTYALNKLAPESAAPMEIVKQRLHTASGMLTARMFLAISLRLSPEGRKGRRKDIVKFEQRVLDHVDASGDWL